MLLREAGQLPFIGETNLPDAGGVGLTFRHYQVGPIELSQQFGAIEEGVSLPRVTPDIALRSNNPAPFREQVYFLRTPEHPESAGLEAQLCHHVSVVAKVGKPTVERGKPRA